jgi:hypothetical protein
MSEKKVRRRFETRGRRDVAGVADLRAFQDLGMPLLHVVVGRNADRRYLPTGYVL